jgi:hypothetical protein
MAENTLKENKDQYIPKGSKEYILKKETKPKENKKCINEIWKKILLNNLIKLKIRKKVLKVKILEYDKRLIFKNSSGNCVDIDVYDKKIVFKIRNRDKSIDSREGIANTNTMMNYDKENLFLKREEITERILMFNEYQIRN